MSRTGENNSNWRGGRRYVGEGGKYIGVYQPDHPRAHVGGIVLEHRLVAEAVLGRYLEPSEVVHHINGDTTDNRPENLEVMTQSEHARLHYDEALRPHSYIRPPAERFERTCPHCGAAFVAVGKKQARKTYCSRECYWSCGSVGAARRAA